MEEQRLALEERRLALEERCLDLVEASVLADLRAKTLALLLGAVDHLRDLEAKATDDRHKAFLADGVVVAEIAYVRALLEYAKS